MRYLQAVSLDNLQASLTWGKRAVLLSYVILGQLQCTYVLSGVKF